MNWQCRKNKKARGRLTHRPYTLAGALQWTVDSVCSRFLTGLIATGLTLILVGLGVWQPLERIAYQGLFRLRGAIPWDDRVVVLAIDNASLQALGKFPWSRVEYTHLIDVLAPAEPSAIVLDILMPEPSPEDRELALAMANQGRVVLAQASDDYGSPLPPNLLLSEAAIAQGHVLNYKDSDGLTRSIVPILKMMPALSLAAAQVYSLTTAPLKLPPTNRPLLINWFGSVRTTRHYSFIDVVRGKISPTAFKDKIVVVGVTATGLDALQTPFDQNPSASGVHLHATAIANILQQNFLHSWYGTGAPQGNIKLVLIVLISGIASTILLAPGRPIHQLIVVIGLCGMWGSLSMFLFQANYLLPVVPPMLLFVLTGAMVMLDERWQISSRLQESEERYHVAIQGANDGVWDWNLKTNQVYFSPRWLALIGENEAELYGSPDDWFERIHPDERNLLKASIAACLDGEKADLVCTYRIRHRDGSDRWMYCRGIAVRDRNGQAYRIAGSQTDITAYRQAEEQLQHASLYDALTGLPNRTLFTRYLEAVIQASKKTSSVPSLESPIANYPSPQYAVLFLDLDRFKVVNDSLGHNMGDRLLVAIAQRLQTILHPSDTLARFGGDEFTLLSEINSSKEAEAIAEQIHNCLASPFFLDGHEVFTTVSIGICLIAAEGISESLAEDVLRNANIAMYQAKSQGKARHAIFKAPQHRKAIALLQLETDLRRTIAQLPSTDVISYGDATPFLSAEGLTRNTPTDFLVYYQPIISLSTGKIAGFEALVRWQHPHLGLVLPSTFIPLAEETGLITSLGLWVLRQGAQQIYTWQQQFSIPLTVSVNISSIELKQSGIIEQIEQIAFRQQIHQFLKLEITESHLMEEAIAIIPSLRKLHALGIGLSIDDFGTGYSSLGRLQELPIDTLKIDRSFIRSLAGNAANPTNEAITIVQTIIKLAHNLNMEVVAEGIETAAQLHELRQLNCDYGQGYFFSKPQDPKTIEALLSANPQW